MVADHPAVFPVDLVSEMLTAFSDPDDIRLRAILWQRHSAY
jgi:DNA modification methylase